MKTVYKSKIGLELAIPLILLFGTILCFSWLTAVALLPIVIFIVHLFRTTIYTIDGDNLIIKSSFLVNETIDINAIKVISETKNLLSSPATSFERLEITYGKYDSVLVSPKLKKEFIAEITSINKNVMVHLKNTVS